MARSSRQMMLQTNSAASAGKQCLHHARSFAFLSYPYAVSIFLSMAILAFSLNIYLITLVKRFPELETLTPEDSHRKPYLPEDQHRQQGLRDQQDRQQDALIDGTPSCSRSSSRTRVSGNRISKAWGGSIALGAILVCHVVMLGCVRNITYCSHRTKRAYLTIPNLLTAVTLCSMWWHMISVSCCAKLILEARLFVEDSNEELQVDILAGPVYILSIILFIMTAPIHWMRQAVTNTE